MNPATVAATAASAGSRVLGEGTIRVCHLLGGDQWAGAEVQLAHLLAGLQGRPGLDLCAVLFAEGQLAAELRDTGVTVAVVEERRVGPVGLVRHLARTLRDLAPEILHAHGYKETILGAVAGRLAGVRRFVRTTHGRLEPWRGVHRAKMGVYAALDRAVLRMATDRVIAVSADLQRHWAARLPADRVVLVRNGLDLGRIRLSASATAVRAGLGIAPTAPVLGTAGRLMPVKGLEHLLAATPAILGRHPDAVVLLVGEGPERAALERQAAALGVTGSVWFLGFRPDVLDIVNAMDVFVLPSLSEGMPMALLEAMALGKPVVASRVGGIPEVLRDQHGWLVPPGDPVALAGAAVAALAAARSDEGRRATAKRIKEIMHLASTMCDQTHALYKELATRQGG